MTKTLLQTLQHLYPQNSRSSLQKWLKWGKVYVNGNCVRSATYTVVSPEQVEIVEKKPTRFPFEVLFEDKDIIVVNKPSGLLSVASRDPTEKNLHALLKKDLKPLKIYPVHRLDKEVSGPLVYAKNEKAFRKLKEAFYEKKPERVYLALVQGEIKQTRGFWESLLIEDQNYQVHVSKTEGKWAKTHYQCLASNPNVSLLQLTLETGRKNQLRVHCAHAAHPIVGDLKYGAEKIGEGSLALMAHKLSLKHPITQKNLDFKVSVPIDFRKIAKKFRLNLDF